MNVLLVGLGRWGEKHLRVLRELGATVWVADVAPARLEWAQKQGVESRRAVRDYRTALASVDAVDIVTPADSHRAIAGECRAAGRHCFTRKPVTIVHYGEIPTVVEANYFVPGTHRECVIVGERGSLVADYGSATVTLHLGEFRRSGAAWEAVDTGKEDLPVHGEEPLRRELAAFLDACAGGTPSPVDASAGVQALVVVEATARAAALGRTVTL